MHVYVLDHYEEQEREWRAKEEAEVDTKEEIKIAMKDLQCIPDIVGLSYEDLFIHQNLDLPKGFKILRRSGEPNVPFDSLLRLSHWSW